MFAAVGAVMMERAATAEYHAVRDGVLICEDPVALPVIVLAEQRGERAVVRRALDRERCSILLPSTPIFIDFFEDVPWRGLSFGEPVGGTAHVARGRMRLDTGVEGYFYVMRGDVTRLSEGDRR